MPEASKGLMKTLAKSFPLLGAIFPIFGIGIACVVNWVGNYDKYQNQIKGLNMLTGQQTGWLYLGCWFYCRTVAWLNFYPLGYKEQVMGGGNMRANVYVYKIIGQGDFKNAVVLQDEGVMGQYNRAGRSLTHFLENCTPLIVCFIMTPLVYGYISFIFVVLACLGRVIHQIGYSGEKGFGPHTGGFVLANACQEIMVGMLLIIAIQGAWVEKKIQI